MATSVNGYQTAPHSNQKIAALFRQIAELLETQGANPFRVQAYRSAAKTLDELERSVVEILEQEGFDALVALPTIGESLAHSIEQYAHAGKLNLLERLRGETAPLRVLTTVPGIGPNLADRIHDLLGIETLPELQAAAMDGRLAQVPGFGSKRVRGVRESLAGRFRRPAGKRPVQRIRPILEPSIGELLGVDREYCEKVAANQLPRIAPRRFNPARDAWLPVLHTERGRNHYTVLFSNTARAHQMEAIRDWVIIYRDDQDGAGQWTVLTSRFGKLRGKRIIRGREDECLVYYATPKEQNHD